MIGLGWLPSFSSSGAFGINPHLLGDSILIAGSSSSAPTVSHATLWRVTLGLKPIYTLIPGSNFHPIPKIVGSWPYTSDRFVYVVFFGAPNLAVQTINLQSLQLNGMPVTSTSVQDVNGGGIPDLVMLFSLNQLRESALTPNTNQVTITGNLLGTGSPLLAISPIFICTSGQACLPDDTVGNEARAPRR